MHGIIPLTKRLCYILLLSFIISFIIPKNHRSLNYLNVTIHTPAKTVVQILLACTCRIEYSKSIMYQTRRFFYGNIYFSSNWAFDCDCNGNRTYCCTFQPKIVQKRDTVNHQCPFLITTQTILYIGYPNCYPFDSYPFTLIFFNVFVTVFPVPSFTVTFI